jgi:branched-chain amino acid transport system ATP-binding protein
MSSEIMLEVENLSAWYGAARILYDLALEVKRGEVVALMGRNGAGKSTTMKAVMGLMARREGSVRFNGRDISRLEAYRTARLGLGFTPEDRRIFSDLTVVENLDVGRQDPRKFADGTSAPAWTSEKLLALFPNLAERRHHLGSQLSGGEQQMLTVARTLMGNPLLVLLDEPSEGVAPVVVEQMANTIVELKAQGLSLLLSEQNLHFAALVCDRVYLLEKGHICWQGSMADLLDNAEVQRSFLTM